MDDFKLLLTLVQFYLLKHSISMFTRHVAKSATTNIPKKKGEPERSEAAFPLPAALPEKALAINQRH